MIEPSAGFSYFPEVSFALRQGDNEGSYRPVYGTLGVDIGNCSTRAASVHAKTGLSVLMADEVGRCRIPSAVYFGELSTFVGEAAIEMLSSPAEALRVVQSAASRLEQGDAPPIYKNEVSVEDIFRELLITVKRNASIFGESFPVSKVALSHRPQIGEFAKSVLVNVAKSIGFEDVCLVPNPIAAAIATDFAVDDLGDHIMVCDLGAASWTFSTISRTEEGGFRLGLPPVVFPHAGDQFDALLYDWAVSELGVPTHNNGRKDAALLHHCRVKKEALCSQDTVLIDWRDSDGTLARATLKRDAFDDLIRGTVESAANVLREAVAESIGHAGRLDAIVLVGGCARIPFVRSTLLDVPGPMTRICTQPENCVALGTGYYASQHWSTDVPTGRQRVRVKATTTLSDLVHRLETHEEEERKMNDANLQQQLASAHRRVLDVYVEKSKQVDAQAVRLREQLAQTLANREYTLAQENLSSLLSIQGNNPELKRTQDFLDSHCEKVGEIRAILFGGVPMSIAFSSQPTSVIVGLSNNFVSLCDITSGTFTRDICNIGAGVLALRCIGYDDRLAIGGRNNAVNVRSFSDGKQLYSLSHGGAVNSLWLTPNGLQLAAGCDDRTIKLWNLESQEPVCTFEGHTSGVCSIDGSCDGTLLLSGSAQAELRLWNIETGRCVTRMTIRSGVVSCVRFFPTGGLAASAGSDGSIRIWDTERGRELARWEGHNGPIHCIAFAPDGRHIVSGGEDRSVRVWDVLSGWEVRTFLGHGGPVRCIAVTADGKYAISGSDDKTLRLWGIGV